MAKEFDVDKTVADFRVVTEKIGNPATTAAERTKLEAKAARLRAAWKKWNGDDELFEMAYGEPFDEQGNATA